MRRIRRAQSFASLELAGRQVDYLVKRSSARRTLSLRVNGQGVAQVNAPLAMPMAGIEAFLHRYADWLLPRLEQRGAPFVWTDGARLPYLGATLCLERGASGAPSMRLEGERLVCVAADVATAVLAWYRGQAQRVLGERLAEACREHGFAPPPPWRLSNARTRWGSLSAQGVVGLSWRLVKAGLPEIDYVIRHELAHLRHRDHSPAFWREVERLCPDYRTSRTRLRQAAPDYLAF